MNQPVAPPTAFVLTLALGALAALAALAIGSPGCIGPAAPQPCDYLGIFKRATDGRYSRHHDIQVVDAGSSAYVMQTAPLDAPYILHTPGVLMDKRSCRVCQVDGYDRYGVDHRKPVLATYPSELPHPDDA